MSDKIIAGLVTFAAILPICAICVIGPAAIGSILAGVIAWLVGSGARSMVLASVAAAALVYGLLKWRHRRREPQ